MLAGTMYAPCVKKNCAQFFLPELRQIATKFDNFWHTDSTKNTFMRSALIVHFTQFASTPYRVKCRCSKFLHNAVIISIID